MKRNPRALILLVWLACLLACAFTIVRTQFVSDLSAFMPKAPNERQQMLVNQFHDGIIARIIMIGIEGTDAVERSRLSHELADRLRKSGLFVGVQNGDSATEQLDRAYFFDNRYLLSPDVRPERFSAGGLHQAISESIYALSGDGGMILKKLFARDPTGETLRLLEQFSGDSQPKNVDGTWISQDNKRAVLLAYTRAPGTDTEAQSLAIDSIHNSFDALRKPQADARILLSGTSVFSVKSRALIEGEVTRLASASLLLVVCLLLLVYRSAVLLTLGLLPVLSGAMVGITAVSLGFGQVHGLTLGFGTTLIGEAVDYSIYFYLQNTLQGGQEKFWRTIWLGVATSVAGFAALLFSGFPGLAQLGVYSICGLIAAAIVTRLVLPALMPKQLNYRDLSRAGLLLDDVFNRATRIKWLVIAIVLAAGGIILANADNIWNRNLSTLSPISSTDQQIDLELRGSLGAPDLRFMVAFTAPDREQALQGAERTAGVLQKLTQEQTIAGFNSPSFILPSQASQLARQAALPDPDQSQARLSQALLQLPVRMADLQGFQTDMQAARTRVPLQRKDLEGTSAALLLDSMLVKRSHDYLVLMPLRSADSGLDYPIDTDRVQTALQATELPRIVVIDLLEESTSLFENYRNEVLHLSGMGCLVIFVLLLAALKSATRALKVEAPLVCAVLCVTAVILAGGTQLSILHLVGLLLVAAIGSNYALFFESGGQSRTAQDHRQMQISLVVANFTTVGSFGILGLSNIPVLSAIGTTVSLGAFFALIFSVILSRGTRRER